MSLARALTRRMRKEEPLTVNTPNRSTSVRKYIDRNQISLPVELLSSTNVLAYDAPDIHTRNFSPISSASSTTESSLEDSDSSPSLSSSSSISSPSLSSIPSSPVSPEPNHLSTYFETSPNRTKPIAGTRRVSDGSPGAPAVPAIPSRAISHTKKSHVAVARERSLSRARSPPPPIASSALPITAITRSSIDMFSSKADASHPFGAELAKVDELAEQFGAKETTIWDEEEQFLVQNGFHKFGVEDYITEIQDLYGLFSDKSGYF
ncbi:MAG: hypothetical protein MMC33_005982 [Icmadophila ericetorum]|nr:hypothetical protein [Icmadophila ericetorum]